MPHRPQIFAHRGASAVAPENTLPAFEKALAMGADGIELDVQCSVDGHLVVIHDFDLSHTTDGVGQVGDSPLATLKQLDAGRHFDPAFAGTPIPTLEEVMDLVSDRCLINIEIKTNAATGGREVVPLMRMIRQRRCSDQVLVSSFNPAALIAMRWHDPGIPVGLLYSHEMPLILRKAWLSPLIAPEALHPHHSMVDHAYIHRAHRRGHYVNTWTVNDEGEAQRLTDLGVDTIITDVPDQIIASLTA